MVAMDYGEWDMMKVNHGGLRARVPLNQAKVLTGWFGTPAIWAEACHRPGEATKS